MQQQPPRTARGPLNAGQLNIDTLNVNKTSAVKAEILLTCSSLSEDKSPNKHKQIEAENTPRAETASPAQKQDTNKSSHLNMLPARLIQKMKQERE